LEPQKDLSTSSPTNPTVNHEEKNKIHDARAKSKTEPRRARRDTKVKKTNNLKNHEEHEVKLRLKTKNPKTTKNTKKS
jgi:hypothetical protein